MAQFDWAGHVGSMSVYEAIDLAQEQGETFEEFAQGYAEQWPFDEDERPDDLVEGMVAEMEAAEAWRTGESETVTTQEAADALHVSMRRVQQFIRDGLLPAQRQGRDWLIRRADLPLAQKRSTTAGWPKGRPRNPANAN